MEPVKTNILDHGQVVLLDVFGSDARIAESARVSYGKGTKKTSNDNALIRYLLRHKHTSPFEMCEVLFYLKVPIFVARQLVRHRTANINEVSGRYSEMPEELYVLMRHNSAHSQSSTIKVDQKQRRRYKRNDPNWKLLVRQTTHFSHMTDY